MNHTHLSLSEPLALHQLSQMKVVTFTIAARFDSYPSASSTILRRALQLALTLGFLSALYVFKQSEESKCCTIRLVKPDLPNKLKIVDDLALSSRSGSIPGAGAIRFRCL